MDKPFIDTRKFTLSDGSVLEIQMTEQFCTIVRGFFQLSHEKKLEDCHYKEYLQQALKSALIKIEKEHS